MTATTSIMPRAFAVWFKDLGRWDASSFQRIKWHWPEKIMAPIGSVLKLRKERVDRKLFMFSDLQPITIHFDGSIEKRVLDSNREYSMDLWFARAGDIVVAKIDLKNGAVAMVPPDWQNVVVTGHFAIYEPDRSKLLPEYLLRIIQANFFKAHLWRNKVGAEGRKEVKLDFFEKESIPIPPMAEQEAIVASWRKAQRDIAATRKRAEKLEAKLPSMVYQALGTPPPISERIADKCLVMWWKDLERWSFNYLSRSSQGLLGYTKSKFPIEPLGTHLVGTMNGYCIKPVAGPTPHKMLKLNALNPAVLDLTARKFVVIPKKIAARFSIHKDDLFICRSVGSYDHVAKCAIATEDAPDTVFPDIMIRVCLKQSLLPAFVCEVVQTPLGRSFFQSNARTAVGMWKIGAEDIANFPIPVPPLPVQREIVERIAAQRRVIARERETAERLSRDIAAEIEALILGTKEIGDL
ncbi:MAG: restriction endonuclease subunit S [Desulforhabdus sp.]|jgi:type I restriction enzyme S subunit|nr:restriction endonuclease subunit S [Desulforhabdus sp.]